MTALHPHAAPQSQAKAVYLRYHPLLQLTHESTLQLTPSLPTLPPPSRPSTHSRNIFPFPLISRQNRASDKCQREKRKTINGDDLLWAMQTVGFEDYIEPLQMYLVKFREAEVRV